ncbi:hypothetical protein DEU56DRAFT_758031 [Suillus clintonianus]|uniref:uncharacterized protein n=1 Tax=Suillus clintonianus TaxID=1904413 RepID=UPI001B86A2B9|nr:uncharacterized protein DEU56DRAFT_758031 [Suillus clintonianus]KAG2129745.1 hypothetical protein DEU56DRAFT_758031 [Suillus clintonianus]
MDKNVLGTPYYRKAKIVDSPKVSEARSAGPKVRGIGLSSGRVRVTSDIAGIGWKGTPPVEGDQGGGTVGASRVQQGLAGKDQRSLAYTRELPLHCGEESGIRSLQQASADNRDTPELTSRTLDENPLDNQEEDDKPESLAGAPDPSTITWPSEELPSPTLEPKEQTTRPIRKTPVPASLPTVATPTRPTTLYLPNPAAPPKNSQPIRQTVAQPWKMAKSSTPSWFHGKPEENAQNFLKEVDRYSILNDLKTEAAKVVVFSTLLSAGLTADLWWTKLDSSKKTTWADMQTEFSKKTGLDYQHEILALHINKEEVGTQVTVAGVPTWAHLQFRVKMQQLVAEAGANETAGLVYQVRENLPTVIKELTTPGLADWTKFLMML